MCLSSVNKNRILRLISALIAAGGFVLTQNQKRITSIETLNQFGTEKYLCLSFYLYSYLFFVPVSGKSAVYPPMKSFFSLPWSAMDS